MYPDSSLCYLGLFRMFSDVSGKIILERPRKKQNHNGTRRARNSHISTSRPAKKINRLGNKVFSSSSILGSKEGETKINISNAVSFSGRVNQKNFV